MTVLPRLNYARADRYDRSRRFNTICITTLVGLATAALAAGMIYMYYRSTMPRMM